MHAFAFIFYIYFYTIDRLWILTRDSVKIFSEIWLKEQNTTHCTSLLRFEKKSYACICDKGLTLNATDIAKNKSISNCKEKNTFKTNCRKPKKVGKLPVSCMRNSDGRGRPCKIQMYQFHNEYLLKYASVSDKKKKFLIGAWAATKGI